jgi:hypothetical protein
MQAALDDYRASLDITMQKLMELQTQLQTATAEMQSSIDKGAGHLQACKKDIPVIETWMARMRKRDGKKE